MLAHGGQRALYESPIGKRWQCAFQSSYARPGGRGRPPLRVLPYIRFLLRAAPRDFAARGNVSFGGERRDKDSSRVCIQPDMAEQIRKSWLRRRLEESVRHTFQQAYETVKVDPANFLLQLRVAYEVPITSFQGVYSVDLAQLDDVADRIIRGGMKMAAAEGAGLGLGGVLTLVPDLGILAGITLRTIQKLSLLYGFQYNTDQEVAELWIAAASAAGVDISRELLEKEIVSRFVPRVIQRIAVQASKEVVEKWSGRVIPLASSLIGAGLNYYFVRAWSARAQSHFRAKHVALRQQIASQQVIEGNQPILSS